MANTYRHRYAVSSMMNTTYRLSEHVTPPNEAWTECVSGDTKNPCTAMEEYVQFETERALRNDQVFNWKTVMYGLIRIESPHHVEEVDLKIKISFSKSNDEDYIVIYNNNSLSYKINFVNDLKSDTDNNDDKINDKLSSENILIKPLDGGINTNLNTYAHAFDENIGTNHDIPSKSITIEDFVITFKIMIQRYFNEGMPLMIIKNLSMPFGIPFEPKLFYKDGACKSVAEAECLVSRNRCGAGVPPYDLLTPTSEPGVTGRGATTGVTARFEKNKSHNMESTETREKSKPGLVRQLLRNRGKLALRFVNDKVAVGEYRQVKVLEFFDCSGPRQEYLVKRVQREAAFAVAAVEKVYAHESLTFNYTVACEVISKWKARLKEDMNVRSDVYVLSNGYKKSSDDNHDYFWEYAPEENLLGLEIIRDQSGNTLRMSQSRIHNKKLVQTLLKGHFTLSLKDSLSGDYDVEKNDFDYAMGRSIIVMSKSITGYVLMIQGCVGSLKANLQHMEVLSTTEA
nr:zinc finger, CCHC-type [Tanacetum cinerariifolium]